MGLFSIDVKRFADKTSQAFDDVVRTVVIGVGASLDRRSPVGNDALWQRKLPGYVGGRFRANWQLGVGTAPAGELYQKSPPATGFPSSAEVMANSAQQIPAKAAGPIYYWVNNLPYALRLEDGWSTQAPQGMVHLTVIDFQQMLNEAVARQNK